MSGRIVYAVAVVLAFVAATLMKRDYEQRHGSVVGPHRRAMALSALFGAALGSKLGMVLFLPWSEWSSMFFSLEAFGDGKTIVGAIAGGVIAVGLMKISPSEMVGDSSGQPPAAQTPRFTASATSRR